MGILLSQASPGSPSSAVECTNERTEPKDANYTQTAVGRGIWDSIGREGIRMGTGSLLNWGIPSHIQRVRTLEAAGNV